MRLPRKPNKYQNDDTLLFHCIYTIHLWLANVAAHIVHFKYFVALILFAEMV